MPPLTRPGVTIQLAEHPGLCDSIGGPVTPAVTMAIKLVQAMTQVDLTQVVHVHRPVQGLCLGFGMNALEPYDLQQVFEIATSHLPVPKPDADDEA